MASLLELAPCGTKTEICLHQTGRLDSSPCDCFLKLSKTRKLCRKWAQYLSTYCIHGPILSAGRGKKRPWTQPPCSHGSQTCGNAEAQEKRWVMILNVGKLVQSCSCSTAREPCGLGVAGQAGPSPAVGLELDFPSHRLPTSPCTLPFQQGFSPSSWCEQ